MATDPDDSRLLHDALILLMSIRNGASYDPVLNWYAEIDAILRRATVVESCCEGGVYPLQSVQPKVWG